MSPSLVKIEPLDTHVPCRYIPYPTHGGQPMKKPAKWYAKLCEWCRTNVLEYPDDDACGPCTEVHKTY